MSLNSILATAPLTTQNFVLKANGTTIGNSLIFDNGTNVGIGNTNTSYTLDVSGTGRFTGALRTESTINMAGTNAQLLQTVSNSVAGDNVAVFYNSNANSYGMYIGAGSGTNHALYITDSTRNANLFKVQGNGNVGIGTGSPSGKLMLFQGTAGNVLQNIVSNQGGSTQVGINLSPSMTESEIASNPAQASIYATDTNYGANILFATKTVGAVGNALAVRMRIASGGGLVINDTSQANGGYFLQTGGNNGGCLADAKGSGDANYYSTSATIGYHFYGDQTTGAKFYVVGGGQIYSTSTSITGISDIRHKENIVNLETGLKEILLLKPRRFDWKEGKGSEKKNVAGFIAQELEDVLPDLVDDWKDTMNATEYLKAIRMSDLIPTIVKAVQELSKELNDLKAIVATNKK
jgi:hypothetical protein